MTKEQLDAIRARVEADPKVGEARPDSEGNIGTVIRESDRRVLLAEVERLTAEVARLRARETQLAASNDALVTHGLREFLVLRDKARDDAFKRGVAAMREAAVGHAYFFAHPSALCGPTARAIADDLRTIPDPEDKS